MSLRAMLWAFEQKVGSPVAKLVLLKLADNANESGVCWPSLKTIARHVEVDRSTVIRHIRKLEEKGFLRIVHRQHEGVALSNHYHLVFEGGGTVPLGSAEGDQGGDGAPPPVVAENDQGGGTVPPEPPNDPVIEPPPAPGDGGEEGGGGEQILMVGKPAPQSVMEDLLAAAVWAADKANNKIGSPTGWMRAVRQRLLGKVDLEDLQALESWRAHKNSQDRPAPKASPMESDPDAAASGQKMLERMRAQRAAAA